MNQRFVSPAVLPGDEFDEPIDWDEKPKKSSRRVIALGLASAITLLVAGYAAAQKVEVRGVTPPTPLPCSVGANALNTVGRLLTHGQLADASSFSHVEAGLAQGPRCHAVRAGLEQAAYQADSQLLFTRPCIRGNLVDEQARIKQWQTLRDFARRRNISPVDQVPPATVEQQAYALGCFAWARAAWLEAWRQGAYLGSGAALSHYFSVIFNLGDELVSAAPVDDRVLGLRIIALSAQIAHKFRLPRGEARRRLTQLLGSHPQKWPRPAPDPLLGS